MRAEVPQNLGMELSAERCDRPLQAHLRGRKDGLEPIGEADFTHDERMS